MKRTSLIILTLLSFTISCTGDRNESPDFKNEIRPSAVPLITVDPYFSIWSFDDCLNKDYTRHWTGVSQPLEAYLRVDGNIYRIMGIDSTQYREVVPSAKTESWKAKYMIMKEDGIPGPKWYEESYDDSSWNEGKGSFSSYGDSLSGTYWDGVTDIYIRRDIELDSSVIKKGLSLEYKFDEDIKIYLNDSFAVLTEGYIDCYDIMELTDRQLSYLKPGHNFIACHCLNRNGNCNFDFGFVTPIGEDKQLAVQKSLNVLPTRSIYTFTCGPVDMELTFTAPLLLSDLDLVARPVNYISYEVSSNDGKEHDVQFFLSASPKIAIDKSPVPMTMELGENDGIRYAKTGTISQSFLAKKGDNRRIDWGYFYLASNNGIISVSDKDKAYESFISSGKVLPGEKFSIVEDFMKTPTVLTYTRDLGNIRDKKNDFLMVAYDDIYSIQYFWTNLRPYWNRSGKNTIMKELKKASDDFQALQKKCKDFDNTLTSSAMEIGGKKYAELCAVAYRQSIAAHKLTESPDGDILFLSKECCSNGSIGTVDVSFPSSPLYLLYNPELVKGMMNPIFYISESRRINKPFAVHDVGCYPIANGCLYGDGMPVEESGNMLIMAYAVAKSEGNAEYAKKHWETLTTWVNYLMQYGADPAEQLCTDDFGGHLAHNANLAIKAILAIASYGKLALMNGDSETGNKYFQAAQKMAKEWEMMADDGDHYRIAYDRPGTWSLKYNLVWDKVLGLNIFDPEISKKEVAWYISKQNEFGVPLDYRKNWTKTDWIIWSASLSNNMADFQNLTDKVWKFQCETSSRVPMSDFFFSDKPICVDFRARSVVGAYYIKMLENKYNL